MERIAVLSDIHGNLTALEAVLDDLTRRGIRTAYCLGDVAYRGPQPAECVDRLREAGIPCIYGNTERWLDDPPPPLLDHPQHSAVLPWCREQLGPERLAWLAELPFSRTVTLGRHELLLVHGSPRSENEFFYPWLPPAVAGEILQAVTAPVVLVGHHHLQMLRRAGSVLVVGPGSVGLPFDGDPRAAYAILESAGDDLSVHLVRIPYDVEKAQAAAAERGFPDLAWFRQVTATGEVPA